MDKIVIKVELVKDNGFVDWNYVCAHKGKYEYIIGGEEAYVINVGVGDMNTPDKNTGLGILYMEPKTGRFHTCPDQSSFKFKRTDKAITIEF